jgi:hypothetical protein
VGASLTVSDRQGGQLARGGSEHAITLLDTLSASETTILETVDDRARWLAGVASRDE